MRVRPLVTLTVAGLMLGACGSSAKSAAPPQPIVTPTTTVAKTTATTPASSTPVTDLDGHKIVGVKAQDVLAESLPDKPLDHATHALLAAQLVAARAVAMRYPTVADATAAGYHLVGGGFGPGSGAHYVGGGYSFNFDPSHPLALIYDGIRPTSVVVGLMYYSLGATAPAGFVGPNDHWHRHSGVCLGSGGDALFPPDSDVTARKCAIAHGSFMAVTGWMVHAWVVPGWESPKGVFSHENPDLPCADGTFHTDAVRNLPGLVAALVAYGGG